MKIFDVAVIGAGHAGCEAALAAARMNARTLLLTISLDRIAMMPCNPSVGGIGKGHLVSEVDVLGGEIAYNSDKSTIQIKTLNMKKGPAVRALRAQSDRLLYSLEMRKTIEGQSKLTLIEDLIETISVSAGKAIRLKGSSGTVYEAKSVIVAAGTFLTGKVIIGTQSLEAGRMGERSANELTKSLKRIGVTVERFQSATPPRVDGRSIDFSQMVEQPGDDPMKPFSHRTKYLEGPQKSCYLTYTNEKTHQAVENNLHRSPIKTGMIESHGPRFCPSIDRKIINFPDKKRHPVFVEPEGWNTNEFYLQGLTTSLPVDAQVEIINLTPGLSGARITRPGYAIEYDFFPPNQLYPTLESKCLENLFFAGQVNGTSGYEEAAAQGIIAGINAVKKVRGEKPFVLDRSEAYIGVLIDDLVTKGVDEPYRMFTSRAEFRLMLRCDNADIRLTEMAYGLGLVSEERRSYVREKAKFVDEAVGLMKQKREKISPSLFGKGKNAESLAINGLNLNAFFKDELFAMRETAINEIKYGGYIARQNAIAEKQKQLEKIKIPGGINYRAFGSLRYESVEKLDAVKPLTLGQASRIPGITPADISILNVYLQRDK